MEDVIKIASYICERYYKEYGQRIDEMKLHKLLYLLQREAIIQTGEPLFADQFEAWKYGLVLYIVHKRYHSDGLHEKLSDEAIARYKQIFDKIFDTFATKTSWSLSTLTHGEYSWQKAREGYALGEYCEVKIKTDDIKVDAKRIKSRRSMIHILGITDKMTKLPCLCMILRVNLCIKRPLIWQKNGKSSLRTLTLTRTLSSNINHFLFAL